MQESERAFYYRLNNHGIVKLSFFPADQGLCYSLSAVYCTDGACFMIKNVKELPVVEKFLNIVNIQSNFQIDHYILKNQLNV